MGSQQSYTDDQLRQVEYMESKLQDLDKDQGALYKDLSSKMTFLFGAVAAVLTFYGTTSMDVSYPLKSVALLFFGISAILLCVAFQNRKYYRAPKPDIQVKNSTYFDKVYKHVAYLEKVCDKNTSPLKSMGIYVRWSVWAFTVGVLFLIASLLSAPSPMVHCVYEHEHSFTRTTECR